LPIAFVVMVNLALVDPAATVTLGGTVAATGLSLVSATGKPPAGAAEVSVTVPVDDVPPMTSVGLTVTLESVGVDDGGGGGGELTVQPDKVAVAGVAEPSLTETLQSAGFAKELLSTRKFPAESLVPIATPFTAIVRFAMAVPSMRTLVPLSSARVIWTAARAEEAASKLTSTSKPNNAT
jgi:hypothetical protein